MDAWTAAQGFIQSTGFPIAACVALFIYIKNDASETRKAMEQNTLVLTRLLTYLEKKEGVEIDGQN